MVKWYFYTISIIYMAIQEITVPDIGDFDSVEIIEVLVSVGDEISADDSIITLESDKASMEIPSPTSGKITDIKVNVGDKVAQGDVVLSLETAGVTTERTLENTTANNTTAKHQESHPTTQADEQTNNTSEQKITVPDIGDFDSVEIIEVLVSVGDEISADDSIITLESDKASMEIPAPIGGKITAINIAVGDKVAQGDEVLTITTQADATQNVSTQTTTQDSVQNSTENTQQTAQTIEQTTEQSQTTTHSPQESHASPGTRKLARELGVDLGKVSGSGQKGRITEEDLKAFVKNVMQNGGVAENANSVAGIPQIPNIDFAKFGEIEEVELSRINKISGKHLHACWLNVPHVTQFDEANIDELEVFRKIQKSKGNKFTPIVFIIKAVVHCLKLHPRFNSSLDGDSLIMKKYFNIGVAVDTPNGLMVPVIKNADTKSLTQLQTELVELAKKARDGKLGATDLQGACFSISSLGGIGGTNFTPIVNSPEVAILGVAKSQVKPVWNGAEFIPTTMLPLALSYDHRVIDGALGARFITDLSSALEDIREVLL
jgi:pyruvate dehydrogenase E2 component (dihydrolipoamide acetyltransferase)